MRKSQMRVAKVETIIEVKDGAEGVDQVVQSAVDETQGDRRTEAAFPTSLNSSLAAVGDFQTAKAKQRPVTN